MGADDHNAPGEPNAPEALRPKMGQNAELAKALAAKMANAQAEVVPEYRPPGFSGSAGQIQRAGARISGRARSSMTNPRTFMFHSALRD